MTNSITATCRIKVANKVKPTHNQLANSFRASPVINGVNATHIIEAANNTKALITSHHSDQSYQRINSDIMIKVSGMLQNC